MITNSALTIYHKGFDKTKRQETYTRYNYSNVWYFGGKGAGIKQGYTEANDVQIRIPYSIDLDITKFAIGDIIVKGTLDIDIDTQDDLKGYDIYNIKSINDNNFGNNPHIYIGGK